MRYRTLISVLSTIIFALQAHAQYDHKWMLGYGNSIILKPAIEFTSSSVDTFSFARPMQYFISNSSICDNNSNLLFSTNGRYIENRNGDTLFNSQGFNPGWLTANGSSMGLGICQGVITIPFPDDTNKYIVFHESAEYFYFLKPGDTTSYPSVQPFHLGYSIIDMSLDSGMGGVVVGQKDVQIVNDTLFQGWITACKHANGRDWWLLVHKWYSDKFYKILITPQGVVVSDEQNIGPIMLPDDGLRDFDINGQACFSPDGSKYVMAGQSNIVDLFDFDRCTGLLSNHRSTLIDTLDRVRRCAFSPNSRYLYVSSFLELYQFDTWQLNLDSAGILVAEFDSFLNPNPTYFYMWQLAPNGKIYGNTWSSSKTFHVIDNPDNPGLSSNVLQHSLPITNFNVCQPNFPNFNLGSLVGSNCDTLTNINNFYLNRDLNLSVFPNPVFSNLITIKYSLEPNKSGAIKIFNSKGESVFSCNLSQWSSIQELSLPDLKGGIYYLILQSGDKVKSLKFIKY